MAKKQKNKNPLLQKKWSEGFDQGFNEAKRQSAAHFAVRLERLEGIKGIGPKLTKEIQDTIRRDMDEEEFHRAELYAADLRGR